MPTSVDWSKYGFKDEEERSSGFSSVDWNKYGFEDEATKQRKAVNKKAFEDEGFGFGGSKFMQSQENIRRVADNANLFVESQPKKKELSPVMKLVKPISNGLTRVNESIFGKPPVGKGNGAPDLMKVGKKINNVSLNIPGTKADDAVANFIRGAGDSASFGFSGMLDQQMGHPERTEGARNTTAGKVGQIGGMLVPGAAAWKLGSKIVNPLVKNASKGIQTLARGSASGATFGVARESGEAAFGVNNQTLKERALDVGIDTAVGGVGDVALSAIGRALRNTKVGQAFSDYLTRSKSVPKEVEQSTRLAFESAQPQKKSLGNLRVAPKDQYVNRVMAQIKDSVYQRMTPPLENQNELAKWLKPHLGEGVSLNEIRKLPYEDMRQLAEEVQNNMSMHDVASQVAREQGFNLDELFAGKLPSLKQNKAQDASRRAYGIYPEKLPDINRPLPRIPNTPPRSATTAFKIGDSAIPTAADGTHLSEARPIVDIQHKDGVNYYRMEGSNTYMPENQVQSATKQRKAPKSEVLNEVAATKQAPEPVQNQTFKQAENVADDVELPQADEVAPRVRDRVNSFADEMIKNAQEELKRSRGRLSSTPVDTYAQYAKIGAAYMLKGSVKLADFTETMVRHFGEEVRPHVKKIFAQSKDEYKQIQKQIESEELGLHGFDATKLRDLSNINLNTADVNRNFRKVFGENFEPIKRSVLDPFDEAKGAYSSEQKAMTDKLHNDVVKGLGISKGSKESALVQKYGEGQITLEELQKQAPQKWEKIVEADKWFRSQYNELITKVNESVARIYPNNPDKLVPLRKDYYRHFQEMTAWSGLKNLFDTSSARISPSLSGLSPFTQPKTKWASFKQKRGLGEFKNDAVGGFLDYIPAASYAMHIDPHISVFRNLAKRLAADTDKTANVNNFIKYLNNYANDLSGKTSDFDRWVEGIGGRNGLKILTQVNNRVKKNVILGNVRSALSQFANIPNGIAYGGVHSVPGAIRTLESVWKPNEAMAKSAFLKERYLDKSFRRFNTKLLEQPERFAEWMMETSDRVGTSFVWNTAYARGVKQKVADPVKFADEQARRLVGGRGIGEQPLLIKSKVFNLIAPFQLEVNNLWRVMKDFTDEKRFGALATLFVSSFLLNKAFEKATGSGVVFDPIDAVYDAATMEDATMLQRGGRLGGEVLSSLPFGQHIAALYPEYGANMYGIEMPAREQLFGDKDPTRFGTGLLATNAITDPVFKLIMPFGGNQVKKSIQGLDALLREGSYTESVLTTGKTIESPKLKFPVTKNPADVLRGLAFGPYATSQGQTYTRNDNRPLSENQTRIYSESESTDKQGTFDKIQKIRDVDALKSKIDNIKKDNTKSIEQRLKEIGKVTEKINRISSGN